MERAVGERSEMLPVRLRGGVRVENRLVVSRSAALGEGAAGFGSADFGRFGADPGVEILSAQAVAVAFEREDL